MFPAHITVTPEGVVREVVYALHATGFYSAPRQDIQPGDVLTQDEKIAIGLEPKPNNYVAPVFTAVPTVMVGDVIGPDPNPPEPPAQLPLAPAPEPAPQS